MTQTTVSKSCLSFIAVFHLYVHRYYRPCSNWANSFMPVLIKIFYSTPYDTMWMWHLEAEERGLPWVWGRSRLHSEFLTSVGYRVRDCLSASSPQASHQRAYPWAWLPGFYEASRQAFCVRPIEDCCPDEKFINFNLVSWRTDFLSASTVW